jgi:squalene-hopene/tetraprenyl-beta-curcumene cyclase
MRRAYLRFGLLCAALLLLGACGRYGLAAEPPTTDEVKAKAAAMMDKGIEWLLAQQKADGSFSAVEGTEPAVTALALRAMATSPSRDELMKTEGFKKALAFVLSCIKEDGGVYIKDWAANYHTSVALSALAAINDPELREQIDKSQAFLKELQADEGEGLKEGDTSYGGFGYRKGQREGDMSNLQFALCALRDSGLTADDAAWGKALEFVERCQNLETDGGFIYRPGESKAGEDPNAPEDETLYRSYTSMTYVGLLSMIYCNVDRNDERVQKAVGWLKAHWNFDENYPLGLQGLFYSYHTLARALTAYGERTLVDDKGVAHDWYAELVDALAKRQNKDGSWVNTEKRWFEDDNILVTTYCLLALAYPYEWYGQ